MAKVLSIVDYNNTVSIDLLNGTLKAVMDTWRSDYPGDGSVVETMELVADDTDANIITAVTGIDEACEGVVQYWSDRLNGNSYYLKETATSETAKWAIIFEMYLRPIARLSASPLLGATPTTAHYSLTIIRRAAWSDNASVVLPLGTKTLSSLGGYSPIAAISGNLPAEFDYILFTKNQITTGLNQFWMGIKPNYGDSPTKFRPLWELEDGTVNGSATIGTSVACSGAGANYISAPIGTSMAEWVGMTVDQATATTDYSHFRGRFLVLLRCALSAAGTVGIQMRSGYDGSDSTLYQQYEEVYITNTSYKLVPLGEIQIPSMNLRQDLTTDTYYKNFEIQVWAERLSGTPALYLDALVLVPSDHFAYGGGAGVRVTQSDRALLRTTADGVQFAVNLAGSSAFKVNMDYVFRNFTIPIDGGVFVIAAEQAGSQVVADNIDFKGIQYFPRHRTHRE